MDNVIVGITGLLGLVVAQLTNGVVENISALGIVAAVVYFFLFKFDKKLDKLEDLTLDIHKRLDEKDKE